MAQGYLRFQRRATHSAEDKMQQSAWFLSGLALMYLVLISPIDTLGREFLFFMRMIEVLLIVYIIPCFLLRGLPSSALSWLHEGRGAKLMDWSNSIVGATLIFNLLFTGLHWPPLYSLFLNNIWLNQTFFLAMLILGCAMWLPVVSSYPGFRLSIPRQMFYMVTLIFGQTPLFAFLTFSQQAAYAPYINALRVTSLSPYGDQQLGGWLLKIITSLVFAGAFIAIFLNWNRQQRSQDRVDNRVAFENFDLVQRAARRDG